MLGERTLWVAIVAALLLAVTEVGHAYTLKNPDKVHKEKGTLVGLVEAFSDQEVYITTNWTSRSRASYRVTGSMKNQMAQLKGHVVKVEGKITRTNPWSGSIEVERVLTIKGSP